MAVKQSTSSAYTVGARLLLAPLDSYHDTSKPANNFKCAPNLPCLSVLLVPYIICCMGFFLLKLQDYIMYSPQNYEHLSFVSTYLNSSTELLEILLRISNFEVESIEQQSVMKNLEAATSSWYMVNWATSSLSGFQMMDNKKSNQEGKQSSGEKKNQTKKCGKLCFCKIQ